MNETEYKKIAKIMLKDAGISINGNKPYDLIVHNDRVFKRVFKNGSVGLGESYMDGDWDAAKLDEFFYRLFKSDIQNKARKNVKLALYAAKGQIMNLQSPRRAYRNAQLHYDIGNDLYEPMLGPTMAYTCAYWDRGAKTLDQAQIDKFDLICEKLGLKKGMKVLDPGCGWGGLSIHMAKKYGCEVVCFTPAKEQIAFIKAHTKGLNIRAKLSTWQDYDGKTKFDRIASIGMMEHVGPKNYRKYLVKMRSILKDDGLMLLHTIGGNRSVRRTDPWIDKYIFPGAVLPSAKQLSAAMEGVFIIEDWHNLSTNYDKTLLAWYANFKKSYPTLDHNKYDQRFYRMWKYYLLICAALFRSRSVQLWQIVLSPRGVEGGYKSIR
jgi:cyclopropane-fatty-acyl-phospholipid synthase